MSKLKESSLVATAASGAMHHMHSRDKIDYNKDLEHLLKDNAEECESLGILHRASYEKYNRLSNYINIPVIILSSAIGFATGLDIGYASMNIILGVGSIFVGIIKSIDTYFQLGKRSESHRLCSLQYQQIHKKIQIELALTRDQRQTAKDMLSVIKTDIKNLQDISPLVDQDIIDSYNALSCYAIKTTWFNNTGLPTTLGTTHTTARIWLRGDIVVDATNTYQALQDVPTGTLLTNTAYWQDNGLKSVAYGMQPGRVGNEAHTWHVGKYGTVGVTNAAGETAPGFETYFGKVWQPGGQLNTTYANWYTTRSTALGTPGDYSPPGGSPLLNRIPAGMAWGPFDMYGTTIPNDGTGAAGAYQ